MHTVGLDSETAPVEPGRAAPPLACVAIGSSDWQTLFHHTDWIDPVVAILEDDNILITGHNVAYDFVVIMNEAPWIRPLVFDAYEANRVTCTQCRQKLSDIAGGCYRSFEDIDGQATKLNYALEDLALRHLGRQLDKSWTLEYGKLRPLPLHLWPEGARLYPKEDVRAAVDIWGVQEKNSFFLEDQFRQARAALWLRLMTTWGIRTDERAVDLLAQRTERDYTSIAADVRMAGLLRPDKIKRNGEHVAGSRDVKATRARVVQAYAKLGKEPPLTDGGKSGVQNPCTDKVTCQESGDPILIKYANLSSLKTVLSKDIPMLRAGVRTPIHVFIEDILETGRVAMRPNFQNLKRFGGIRECVTPTCLRCGAVPVPGHEWCRCGAPATVLGSCDYSGLELCAQAQMCLTLLDKSRLATALNENMDPHLMIAAQILKRPYEELKAIKKAGAQKDCRAKFGVCSCAYCIMDHARQVGKVANFGFPGGLGPDALVFFALNNYNVHLTVQEAIALKRVWLETWPEFRDYFNLIGKFTGSDRYPMVEQLFSRRFRGGVRFTEACNSIFQGLGADISKAAGWLIYRAMYDATIANVLYGSRGVNFIHDEFVWCSPLPVAHECAVEVSNLMIKAAKPWLPGVKIKAEPALMWRYSKDAGTKYDNSGRLIPWAA